ncbi:TPA: type IV secretion system protein [Vibrio parahaemolyticus]
MDIAVFQYIGISIDNATQHFIVEGVGNLIDAIKPIVITCVSIYLMTQAYLQIAGKSDDLAVDVIIISTVVICITTLTLNVANYTNYVIEGVQALGSGLASSILPSHGGQSVYEALDSLLQTGVEQMSYCFGKIGMTPSTWIWFFCGLLIILSVGTLSLVSACIVIGTKFLLTMLLIVGPIFIVMACFPPTRKFIDNWMGKVFENILVQLFGVAVVFMVIELVNRFIQGNDLTAGSEENPAAIAVQVVAVSVILSFVIKQIPNLAGGLAGGFASTLLTPSLPRINPDERTPDSADRINNRETWAQQQQNQISSGGAKSNAAPSNELSQDLRDRIAEHNMKNK